MQDNAFEGLRASVIYWAKIWSLYQNFLPWCAPELPTQINTHLTPNSTYCIRKRKKKGGGGEMHCSRNVVFTAHGKGDATTNATPTSTLLHPPPIFLNKNNVLRKCSSDCGPGSHCSSWIHLEACRKCKFSGPMADLLNERLKGRT